MMMQYSVRVYGTVYVTPLTANCKPVHCISDNVEEGLESRIVSHLSFVSTLEYLLEVRTNI